MSKKGAVVFLILALLVANVGCICTYLMGKSHGKLSEHLDSIDVRCYGAHSETADDAEAVQAAIDETKESLTWSIVGVGTITDVPPAEVNITDDLIRELGKSGRICKVFGHQWTEGNSTELDGVFYDNLTIPYEGYHRECKLCGLYQTRKLTDWE